MKKFLSGDSASGRLTYDRITAGNDVALPPFAPLLQCLNRRCREMARGIEGEITFLHVKRVRTYLGREAALRTLKMAAVNGLQCWKFA